jgi:hypothetical protein
VAGGAASFRAAGVGLDDSLGRRQALELLGH